MTIATASVVTVLPPKLSRYAAVAIAVPEVWAERRRSADDDVPDEAPEALARDLESLGPTFVKLGQVLSTRAGSAAARLSRSAVAAAGRRRAVPVRRRPDASSRRSWACGCRRRSRSFEETPLAAASLGQVHRAALRDGRIVAVKVQRPGVAEQVADDLEALDEIAQFLTSRTGAGKRYDLPGMVDEFRTAHHRRARLPAEADHLRLLGKNLASSRPSSCRSRSRATPARAC